MNEKPKGKRPGRRKRRAGISQQSRIGKNCRSKKPGGSRMPFDNIAILPRTYDRE